MYRTAYKFETFIQNLFKSYKLDHKLISENNDTGVDIEINKENNKYGVEIKAYRSRRIPISTFKNSLIILRNVLAIQKYEGGIFICTANIEPTIREQLKNEFKIEILDRGILFSLTNGDEKLRNELETLLLELSQSGEDDIYEGIYSNNEKQIEFIDYKDSKSTLFTKSNEGELLHNELISIKRGKTSAKNYEIVCEKILKYIFENDFSNWHKQNQTSDTLHIFDLIAKISSTNDFWRSLARDFHSRYIVFEFKNYTEKIKQGQVYSTEKYLYKTALRNIAFILTRDGADKNAIIAMEGALRETGKLIISLNQNDIHKLLKMKDTGDDPNSYLTEIIDNRLMKLSR